MRRIAVIITCYNRLEITKTCIYQLFSCKLPDNAKLEVFLVDDNSPDKTGIKLKELFPQIHVIFGNGKLFWNRGMHLAWETAAQYYDYDYYLWLNDDTLLFEDSLHKLISESTIKNNKAIVVGSTCSKNNKTITYGGYTFNGNRIFLNGTIQECDYFNGNCVLIPKYVYKILGNLDPIFHHAIGDLDYGLRARKKNIKMYIIGSYVGYCEAHEKIADWCSNEVPFLKRIKSMYSPLGNLPHHFFIFEYRHFGLYKSVKHFFSMHVRVLFPNLYKS